MSFLQEVETRNIDRVSLAAGSYGTARQPGLKILAYIEKASKLDRSGAMRHGFLCSALHASREQLAAEAAKNGKNGGKEETAPGFESDPFASQIPDYEGTAFLHITLHELWLTPEATALAFTEASRNKEGVIQADYVAKAIADGEATEESIDQARAHFLQVATDKVIAANTPSDQIQEAVDKQYQKELTQISIKVGQFVTLEDWKGVPRSLQFDPKDLVSTEFSGKVESREFNGKTGSEVTAIYSRKK
jgi:hypothetical protein